MSTNLPFNIAGKALALLETPVKDKPERKYHCFRLPNGPAMFGGQSILALAQDLPKTVEIDGLTITLEHHLSPATRKDRTSGETIKIDESKRYAQASFKGAQTFPSLKGYDGPEDEGIRNVSVLVSSTHEGATWNVKVSVNRIASVSPEDRKAKAIDKATATLAAMMAAFDAAATTEPAKVA